MDNTTRGERREGERLLKAMAPRARAEAEKILSQPEFKTITNSSPDAVVRSHSPLGEAVMPHIRLSNTAAVLIHQGDLGGWIADLLLKEVPLGYPKVVGTPVSMPMASRKKAEEAAHDLLVMAALNEMRTPEAPDPEEPADVIFSYHDFSYRIPGELTFLLKLGETVDTRSVDELVQHLRDVESKMFPNGITEEAMNTLPREGHARLMSIFTCLLAKGVFRYPASVPHSLA